MLPYNESAIAVKQIAQYFLAKKGETFKLDDDLKRLYRLLTLYFTNNPEFETYFLKVDGGRIPYSLKKGNLLIGSTGRSKSFLYEKVFKMFTHRFIKEKAYRTVGAYQIQLAFETNGLRALKQFRQNAFEENDNIYVDEIGIENFEVNHYGNKQSPVASFLHERHRLYTSSGFITHGSTNLMLKSDSAQNLKDAYGDRNYSRLFEMFNIIITTGPDLRINVIPDLK